MLSSCINLRNQRSRVLAVALVATLGPGLSCKKAPASPPQRSQAELSRPRAPSLLDRRLTVRLPAAAREAARREGVAPGISLSHQETRMELLPGPGRLLMWVGELFVTAGDDLAGALQRAGLLPAGQQLASPRRNVEGLTLVEAGSLPGSPSEEGLTTVSMSYVVQPDRTVQAVGFFADRQALKDRPACEAMAQAILASLGPGPRRLTAERDIPTSLSVPGSKPIDVTIPKGYVASVEPGPDYAVHELRPLAPLGTTPPLLKLWVSGEAPPLYSSRRRIHDYKSKPGALLGKAVTWRHWTGADGLAMEETIVAVSPPGGAPFHLHAHLMGRPDEIPTLRKIVASLGVRPPAPEIPVLP